MNILNTTELYTCYVIFAIFKKKLAQHFEDK
jgi:hypothetical protein